VRNERKNRKGNARVLHITRLKIRRRLQEKAGDAKAVKAKKRCRGAEEECRLGVSRKISGKKSAPCTVVLVSNLKFEKPLSMYIRLACEIFDCIIEKYVLSGK